jgi:hypothetical protein
VHICCLHRERIAKRQRKLRFGVRGHVYQHDVIGNRSTDDEQKRRGHRPRVFSKHRPQAQGPRGFTAVRLELLRLVHVSPNIDANWPDEQADQERQAPSPGIQLLRGKSSHHEHARQRAEQRRQALSDHLQ